MILKEFDQNTARLIPNIIEMKSELELSTYTISQWYLVYFEDGKAKQTWKEHVREILINVFLLQMMTIKVSIINMILQEYNEGSC